MSADDDRAHEAGHLGVGVRQGSLSRAPAGSLRDPALRFWLRPSVEPFAASGGALYLQRPGEREDLVIRAPSAADRALIASLRDGPADVVELRERMLRRGADLEPGQLDALHDAGVLMGSTEAPAPLPAADAERFARQLPWFAEWREPTQVQRGLRAARVVVLGCGGLGCWAVGALACAGIGGFTLIDDDVVELSNLNRQVLFSVADVGAPKVECAARWLRAFDPAIRVEAVRATIAGPERLRAHLEGAAALILVADRPPHRIGSWAGEACCAARVPWIAAGQTPPILRVGPTYVPGRSACHACHQTQLRRGHPLHAELAAAQDDDPPAATTLGPASGIVGSLIAMEVLHLLAGRLPLATEGRALLLDMRTLEQRWEDVERLDDCPACHHLADDAAGAHDAGRPAGEGDVASPPPPAPGRVQRARQQPERGGRRPR